MQRSAPTAPRSRSSQRCPKCAGQLYVEQEAGTRFVLPPEWACLQCGWRRSYTPRQFERTFALKAEVEETVGSTSTTGREP